MRVIGRYVMILVASIGLVCGVKAETTKQVIGISVPLSGDAALYGQDIKNALVFANDTIAQGRYELKIEDDQCSERSAVAVAQKFASIDKVKYVLGFGCSGALLGAAPVYDKNKILVIASATGAPTISQAGDFIFRTIPSLNVAAQKLQRDAARKYRSIGILSEETAYCQGLKEAFIAYNKTGDLKVVTESYLSSELDLSSVLLKLKRKGVDALFLNPQTEAGLVRMVKQLRELRWSPALYAAYYPGSPSYLNEFGASGDGVVYADLPFPFQYLDSEGTKMYADFRSRYGEPKSGDYNIILSLLAFAAMDKAIQSNKDPKTYLYGERFHRLVSDYGFDANGDIDSQKVTFVLKTIKNGVPAPAE